MTNDEQDPGMPYTLGFQYNEHSPISEFDETDLEALQLNDEEKESAAATVQSLVPQTVLLGSLLEHLCSLHESDEQKAHELFIAICERLTKIHVLSPIAYLHEFTSIRSQYKAAFYNVIQSSIANLRENVPNNALPLANGCNPPFKRNGVFEFNVSRYRDEFEQMSCIGRGGYGNVYQAKSKIDNQIYAIKTIHFSSKSLHTNEADSTRLLREVQILAGLQHQNIVRYHSAWIEHKYLSIPTTSTDRENDTSSDGVFLRGDYENFLHKSTNSSPSPKLSSTNESISWEDNFSFSENKSRTNTKKDGSSKFWGYSSESSSDSYSVLSPNSKQARFSISPHSVSVTKDDNITWDHNGNTQHTCRDDNSTSICFACQSKFNSTSLSPPSGDGVILTHGVRRDRELRKVQSFIIPNTAVKGLPQDTEKFIEDQFLPTSFDSPQKRSYSMSNMRGSTKEKHLLPAKLFPVTGKKNIGVVNHIGEKLVMYIQMQLCQMSLKEWLLIRNKNLTDKNNTNSLSEADAISITKQILTALSFIHNKGLIHRDIKPRNIFINITEGNPKVLIGDFGLARENTNMEPITPLVAAGNPFQFHKSKSFTSGVGTATYAAPEQLSGDSYDTKADMYSVGIVIYELWCALGTAMERANHLKLLRSPDVQIPGEFKRKYPLQAAAVYQLLQHNPALRPSADDMLKNSFIAQTSGKIIIDQRKRIWELERENSQLKKIIKEFKKK